MGIDHIFVLENYFVFVVGFLDISAFAFSPATQLRATAFGAAASSSTAMAMSSVKSVLAREILDSRGNPTVEVRQ